MDPEGAENSCSESKLPPKGAEKTFFFGKMPFEGAESNLHRISLTFTGD